MILAHEITHALQDQNHPLFEMGIEAPDNWDRGLAAMAVIEGDATLAMSEYLVEYGSPWSILTDLPAMLTMDQSKFNAAPPAIQQSVLFPYMGGMAFLTALSRQQQFYREDAHWRSAILENPPISSEQVMHPEKYLADEKPAVIEPLPEPEGQEVIQNVAGEFGIAMLLEPAVGKARAGEAAAGWDGDRLLISQTPDLKRRELHWVTRWDNPKDAAQFAATAADALEKRIQGLVLSQGGETREGKTDRAEVKITRTNEREVRIDGIFRMAD
jgi:hypothetical protein